MNIDLLKAELQRDEGTKLKPYRDSVGKLSVGTGRNLDDVGIHASEADLMLENDIQTVIFDLNSALPWWRALSDNRQRALANMTFNMGIEKLLGFKKMLAALQAADFSTAAGEAERSIWASQVGDRARRIVFMFQNG